MSVKCCWTWSVNCWCKTRRRAVWGLRGSVESWWWMKVERCVSRMSSSSRTKVKRSSLKRGVIDMCGGKVEIKRGGEKSVLGEDRHHKQVLVTVELSFVLCKNATLVQLLVHVCKVE